MKNYLLTMAAALMLAAPTAMAQAPAAPAAAQPISNSLRKAAEEALEVANTEKNIATSIDRMLAMQTQQNPNVKAMEPVFREFFNKYMSWAVIKEDLVQLYAREFTEKELKEMTKFYQTLVGRKALEKMPILMQGGMEIGQRRMQEHMPELQQAIAEKMKSQPPTTDN
ncbi:DUF2059 domain-containing protein [Hymenobacter canadensis]|uniref:DUF2059 domain-containing protein n=1 Tax=Hymenobacter canadensis TaxID=2999067 RepID=A0ABY7LYE3_9BACT|nr:DUF2059 domain-containing protein [Hymenobacter canadensis]WBA43785.1 DUF2059 domain-containing protein [Hymenobacter canadensis]